MRFFFDLDGPILDVSGRYFRVHSEIVQELGGVPGDETAFWESKRARRATAEILAAGGNRGIDPGVYQKLWLERIEIEEYLKSDRLQPNALHSLESLRREHTLSLVTLRQNTEPVKAELERFGLALLFEKVLIANGIGSRDWETKSRLIQSAGPTAEGSWMIGDTEIDLRAGKTLGMITVGVLCGIRDRAHLENENPDYIIGDIGELQELIRRA